MEVLRPFQQSPPVLNPSCPRVLFLMCNPCHLCSNLGPLFVALPTFLEERNRADEIRVRGREDIRCVSWEASLTDLSVVFSLSHFSYSGFHSIKPSSERAMLRRLGRTSRVHFVTVLKCQIRLHSHISTVSFNILDT